MWIIYFSKLFRGRDAVPVAPSVAPPLLINYPVQCALPISFPILLCLFLFFCVFFLFISLCVRVFFSFTHCLFSISLRLFPYLSLVLSLSMCECLSHSLSVYFPSLSVFFPISLLFSLSLCACDFLASWFFFVTEQRGSGKRLFKKMHFKCIWLKLLKLLNNVH